MEQFSHDLTLALEETSRVRAGHCWGGRRRTRSTGNLPCAPQPTEDSSSSPAEGAIEVNECQSNSILSDSDDRQNFQFALKVRQTCLFGNFESDSLNENFSPTRPSTRRKRKFKRMAVEYETTPSTPGNPNPNTMFQLASNAVKKRVIKHTSQENFRAGLFFCGKRKRSHRDRYHDYDYHRLHSSSVPRQRELFTPKGSYFEYKNRNRYAYSKPCERILPLNKTIVSKIEKISQDSGTIGFSNAINNDKNGIGGFAFNSVSLTNGQNTSSEKLKVAALANEPLTKPALSPSNSNTFPAKSFSIDGTSSVTVNKLTQKSGSFDLPFTSHDSTNCTLPIKVNKDASRKGSHSRHKHHKRKQSRRSHLHMQIQFDDPNEMDCGNFNDFLSSSSLSSSDSDAGQTNESDREGDDELTDWPGNEAMVNFASKNDFKRAKPSRSVLNAMAGNFNKMIHGKLGQDDVMAQDEDTLMSADELQANASHILSSVNPSHNSNESDTLRAPDSLVLPLKFSPALPSIDGQTQSSTSTSTSENNLKIDSNRPFRNSVSLPIDIVPHQNAMIGFQTSKPSQIESEMSGETSNHFLSSPIMEVREIRAGCRRIRDERPGFTIFSSVNEHLSRFLQDSRQTQLILSNTNDEESGKLVDLAKLYSLKMEAENGRIILSKTMNTTQSVKIDQTNMSKFLLSDYKRRCYGIDDDSESTEMAG